MRHACNVLVATLALAIGGIAGCDNGDSPTAQVEVCEVEVGQLLITEVMTDPVLGSKGGVEWFEIYNPTDARIELKGLTLEAGSIEKPRTEKVLEVLDPGIEPGGYVVVGDASVIAWTETVGTSYYPWLKLDLSNGGATITIKCESTIVDSFTYGEGGAEVPSKGVALQLSSTVIDNDNPYSVEMASAWCSPDIIQMPAFNVDGDRGTPGMGNAACPIDGSCMENGSYRQNVPCQAGYLVINEVYPNPEGKNDLARNWLEFKTLTDCDLNGLTVRSYNGSDTTKTPRSFAIDSIFCLSVENGTFAVVAGSTESTLNGGISGVVGTLDGPADGQYGSSGGPFLTQIVNSDDTVIAQATYPATSDGVSVSLKPESAGSAENAMEVANWCKSTTTDLFDDGTGTPGQENDECAGQ